MPGSVLHQGATVTCAHAGQATPAVPSPRVAVGGQPVVTQAGPWTVAGCPLAPPPSPPCVSATFVSAALRVRVQGQPVLLTDSQAVCTPTGTGLLPLVVQVRVVAQ